jgi:polyferredoxin
MTAAGAWRGLGEGLRRHQRAIRWAQWIVVALYLFLLVVPAALPLPDSTAHLWSDITLFAQFVFWGVWWPFVLLSMVVLGRTWCGLLCPEGALSEFASRHGRRRAIPRWITWGGWPFVGFCGTTVYGQLVSVYQYPAPALLILGGSTMAAIAVGYLYGREKRVWCRYLCPVSGVFALLAKLAPLHYRVDEIAWQAATRDSGTFYRVNCAPLVPIAVMKGGAQCHMCGRCSGFRGAIALSPRTPNHEIVEVAGRAAKPWETALILYGLMGVVVGAFHWPASPELVRIKQAIAGWLVRQEMLWPLERSAPWWLLTNYPARNDVLNLLDAALLVGYIVAVAALTGTVLAILLALATRSVGPWSWRRFHHLAQALVPLAGCGVFLGLSALTVSTLRAEGVTLGWVDEARGGLLLGAWIWSLWLVRSILRREPMSRLRLALAMAPVAGADMLAVAGWVLLFRGHFEMDIAGHQCLQTLARPLRSRYPLHRGAPSFEAGRQTEPRGFADLARVHPNPFSSNSRTSPRSSLTSQNVHLWSSFQMYLWPVTDRPSSVGLHPQWCSDQRPLMSAVPSGQRTNAAMQRFVAGAG